MNSSCYALTRVSSFFLAIICASIFLAVSSVPTCAQTATGTIVGQVSDPSGAAVVNAEVKVTDPTTNSSQTAKTNEVGRYTFRQRRAGHLRRYGYATGFTQSRLAAQKVDVGESLTLNVTLQVGATSTVVEVQAAAGAELQTLNATVGSTITNESLNLMPNLGRDASTLSVLQVGVSPTGNVAGAATDQNGFQLDGGNNSDDMAGTNTTYTPGNGYIGNGSTGGTPTGVIPTPIESIEEFKVGTSGQTADFNAAAGSQVQMVTKRGTNHFHGALYEFYFGNDVGAANLWKNNHTPDAQTGTPYTPLPDYAPQPLRRRFRRPADAEVLGRKNLFLCQLRRHALPEFGHASKEPCRRLCSSSASSSFPTRLEC